MVTAKERAIKVIVATRLYSPEVGAAAFRLEALADALHEQGAQVRVATTKLPGKTTSVGMDYHVSRWPVLRDRDGYVRGYIQYLSFDIPLFFRLLFSNADVVVAEPPPTTGLAVALSSRLRRRPYIYYAADIWSEALSAMDVPGLVKGSLGVLEGTVLRGAAGVLAVSDPVRQQVHGFRVPNARIDVVGNGINTKIFCSQGLAEHTSEPYFVYTGTMSEWQGAEIFIRALVVVRHSFPTAQIRFFGQGTDKDHLKKIADELVPGAVLFGGVVPPESTASWIRGSAGALVSIKPDQGYDFAKPTKIYAAAGCGKAVIFAGVGAGAELVTKNNLGLAPGYSVERVALAMVELLYGHDAHAAHRSQWVIDNASLQSSGVLAAAEVLRVAKLRVAKEPSS